MTVFALIGAKALYLLFVWLGSAIAAEYIATRKGYGSKAGLASGLLLSAVGVIIWLFVPARASHARGGGLGRLIPASRPKDATRPVAEKSAVPAAGTVTPGSDAAEPAADPPAADPQG